MADFMNAGPDKPLKPLRADYCSEAELREAQWINCGKFWLNTSKNSIIGNEQKVGSFWRRIGAYFNESRELVGMANREVGNCKQRWFKISDQVSKFVGSLRAATSHQSSGQNEDDVMKLAFNIYQHDYGAKFTLEHCWRVLRYEQKWLSNFGTENNTSKRKKGEDGSQASVHSYCYADQAEARPEGVKKAKARLKAETSAKDMKATGSKPVEKLVEMFEIRKQDYELKMQEHELKKLDFEMKEKLNKQAMLESILAKKEPLSEIEVALNNKLISDMLL